MVAHLRNLGITPDTRYSLILTRYGERDWTYQGGILNALTRYSNVSTFQYVDFILKWEGIWAHICIWKWTRILGKVFLLKSSHLSVHYIYWKWMRNECPIIWDKKLQKISQLHGNFVGKQTFSQEDIHLHRIPFTENDISFWLQKLSSPSTSLEIQEKHFMSVKRL